MTFPKLHFNFYQRYTVGLLIFAAFNILLGQFTNIDLMIEDYYFDANTQQFIWKNTWFAKDFMHGNVKYVITDIGRLLLLVVILDFVFSWRKPWRIISHWLRIRLRFVAIASLIIATSVAVFKHFSVLHCPWSVDRYGGSAPFIRLFDFVPSPVQAGHCFPAGHATVGLWLAALCVFWLPHKPKTAFTVFLLGLSVGFALGWVQQMRGAHFLFHTLWATWFATLVIVVMLSLTKQLNKAI
jgi:membrane-associated PAP2 superfamily phosphatase